MKLYELRLIVTLSLETFSKWHRQVTLTWKQTWKQRLLGLYGLVKVEMLYRLLSVLLCEIPECSTGNDELREVQVDLQGVNKEIKEVKKALNQEGLDVAER